MFGHTRNFLSIKFSVLQRELNMAQSVTLETGVTVVLGAVWGDEGKGKLVDFLAQDGDIVCRCNVRNISL